MPHTLEQACLRRPTAPDGTTGQSAHRRSDELGNIFVPALALTPKGPRQLDHGNPYYDHFLAEGRSNRGAAWDVQIIPGSAYVGP